MLSLLRGFTLTMASLALGAMVVCMIIRPTWRNGWLLAVTTAQLGAFLLFGDDVLGTQARLAISILLLLAIATNMHFLNRELTAARRRAQQHARDSLNALAERRNGQH